MVPVMFRANPLSLTCLTKLRKLSITGAYDPGIPAVSRSFTALAGLQELVLEEIVCSHTLQAMLPGLTGLTRFELWYGRVCPHQPAGAAAPQGRAPAFEDTFASEPGSCSCGFAGGPAFPAAPGRYLSSCPPTLVPPSEPSLH
jgi:hypothetical protein